MPIENNLTPLSSPSDDSESNKKSTGMIHNLKIEEYNNEALVSMRVQKNEVPNLVKSLADLFSDPDIIPEDTKEILKSESESLKLFTDPHPVFRINETTCLTALELRILDRLALGRINKEIAEDIKRKESTVKNYLQKIFRKFGINNRTEALLEYQKCKILQEEFRIADF